MKHVTSYRPNVSFCSKIISLLSCTAHKSLKKSLFFMQQCSGFPSFLSFITVNWWMTWTTSLSAVCQEETLLTEFKWTRVCVQTQQITPQLALQVLLQFDKAINTALANRVRNRVNFRVSPRGKSQKAAFTVTKRFLLSM